MAGPQGLVGSADGFRLGQGAARPARRAWWVQPTAFASARRLRGRPAGPGGFSRRLSPRPGGCAVGPPGLVGSADGFRLGQEAARSARRAWWVQPTAFASARRLRGRPAGPGGFSRRLSPRPGRLSGRPAGPGGFSRRLSPRPGGCAVGPPGLVGSADGFRLGQEAERPARRAW